MPPHDAWFAARTMQALEVLAFAPLTAPQVAAALRVHPRTARRMLNRLVDEGYLARAGAHERHYEPTMRLVALAGQIVEHSRLTQAAVPFVTRLRETSGETTHLMVPSYRSALCLVHQERADAIARPQLRELVPAHCTAGGKVLMSWRDAWRANILERPLEQHTPRTTTAADALLEEVAAVRARGYALEDGEYQEGVRGLAAPVVGGDDEVVAALGITSDGRVLEGKADTVVAIADELSAALGAGGG